MDKADDDDDEWGRMSHAEVEMVMLAVDLVDVVEMVESCESERDMEIAVGSVGMFEVGEVKKCILIVDDGRIGESVTGDD